MSTSTPIRRSVRRTRSTVLIVLTIVSASLLGLAGYSSWAASPSAAMAPVAAGPLAPHVHGLLPRLHHRAVGTADGVVPDGTTVFDDRVPAVSRLDPQLLSALRRAGADAESDGVELLVNSGWRSRAYQEHLLEEAISTYGSRAEAARWVATPSTSPHVSGGAVDIGHSEAAEWLAEHGAAYGLCRIYGNEPWHYELRPEAVDDGCPRMYDDPTHDPRMQK
jgi:D-alanyl-D-alanine carboxypeptidase